MIKHRTLALLVLVASVAQADIFSYRAPDGTIVFTDQPTKGAEAVEVEAPMTVPALRTKTQTYSPEPRDTQPLWPEPQATVAPRATASEPAEQIPAYDDSLNSESTTSWSSETQGISSSTTLKPKKKATRTVETAKVQPVAKKKKPQSSAYRSLRVVSPTAGSSRWVGGELTVELSLKPALQPEHVVSLRVDGREVAVGPELQFVVPDISRGGHTIRAAVLDVDTGRQLIVSESVQFQIHRANSNQNTRMLHPSVQKKNNN